MTTDQILTSLVLLMRENELADGLLIPVPLIHYPLTVLHLKIERKIRRA
jgi:hypothetical protein